MAGVRVVQPDLQPGERTPEIDTVEITAENGDLRQRQRIAVADHAPRVVWDDAVGVTSGTTVTLASLVGETGLRLLGFTATGTGDARFRLLVNSVPILGGYINVNAPVLTLDLPVGYVLAAGSTASVQVLASGDGLCDYEATIYGEVTHG